MRLLYIIITILVLQPLAHANSHLPDYLAASLDKQMKPLKNMRISFMVKESRHNLYHSFMPWQSYNIKTTGAILIAANYFYKEDSLKSGKKTYISKAQYNKKALLELDYGDSVLSKITRKDFEAEPYLLARYSPVFALGLFYKYKRCIIEKIDDSTASYSLKYYDVIINLCIRRSDSLVASISTLVGDDLYGDVRDVYTYEGYHNIGKITYPGLIYVSKMNGKVTDTVELSAPAVPAGFKDHLAVPAHCKMADKNIAKPECTVEKFSDHISFLNLSHTGSRSLLVEFKDFSLVAEAPLKTENGELILSQAKKLAPDKPVRYFVFTHFHPHYVGGIRAFVHQKATILSPAPDSAYVQYLVSANHSLYPDSLQLHPEQLHLVGIKDSFTVTDGLYTMKIYFIGAKSLHTYDYMIYYFPAEKMVFEGDLLATSTKPGATASKREKGFYAAIKDLKIDAKTIVQSWPVNNPQVKTVIPFDELEKLVGK